ncbi:MAG: hydroxyacid dehydrogenase [Planctomycetota bacterium]|jgi:D-3-phosphoglycerate dehydrogenase
MLILISDAFAPDLSDKLKKFGEVTDDKERAGEADIVLIRSKTKCTKEYIDKAPNLKMIIRGGVGLDNVDRACAKEKGIIVHNTPQASSIAVAELAMALILSVPNHIVPCHTGMCEGKWLKKAIKRTELYKKTLGLVGIGLIGTEVAKRAAAFGMKIIAFDPYLKSHDYAELRGSLDELLAEADYISLHTPLTDETKGMINRETIAKMKDGAVIANTGRAKVVIEEDIADALKSGKLGAYATDVWYTDPPEDSPITSAPNVVMTPHIGASSKENLLRIGDIIEEKITEFLKNK